MPHFLVAAHGKDEAQTSNSSDVHRICGLTVVINMAFWEDETASMSVIPSNWILGCLPLKDQKIEETNIEFAAIRFCIFCGVCIEADRSPCVLLLERGAKFVVLFPTSPVICCVCYVCALH